MNPIRSIIIKTFKAIFVVITFGTLTMAQNDHAHHPHHAQLIDEQGNWKYTNALINETSPYLLQHAHNPVDWHPWGQAAFDLAREQNKPIFLSIGYATCYWCHVMERQVFENPVIAKQMNEQFINIKVDREQRPDIDDIYMVATQLVSGSGGWPMSVFLTPGSDDPMDIGLKPFFAGTYFPPEPMHGMPSFPQVLDHLHELWQDDQAKVIEAADNLAGAVVEQLGKQHEPGDLDARFVQQAAERLLRVYDKEHGGFGSAPKFPTPNNLSLLMAVHNNNPSDELWQVISHTLDRMARGGMYDQIGGGFHRYSVDDQWLVPHFEKMLYDNGQLITLYAQAHVTRPPKDDPTFYADVAHDIARYVIREMVDTTGAFWSAQDAEVNAQEGLNYLWTPEQIKAAIDDPALSELALELYGLNAGTNFKDPHHADAPATNVLYLPRPVHEIAKERGVSLTQMLEQVREIDRQLLAVRDQREQPGTDDKVLTAWNGIMIAGLAKTGRLLNEPSYVEAAGRAADAVVEHMTQPDTDGRLFRTMRQSESQVPAFLEDYAWLAQAMLELYRATDDPERLTQAKRYIGLAVSDFAAEQGGYHDTLADQPDLFVRTRSYHDGAIPAGNSVMIHNLLDLYELTDDPIYLRQAVRDLRSFAFMLDQHGVNMLYMQFALLRALTLAPGSTPETEKSPPTSRDRQGAVSFAPESDRKPGVDDPHVQIHVDASAESMTGQDDVTITLTLKIASGVHLNSNAPGIDGLQPLQLAMLDGDGVKLNVDYPVGKTVTFAFSDQPVNVYEGEIVIQATVKSKGKASANPRLLLSYQACDDQVCYEPQTVVIWPKR